LEETLRHRTAIRLALLIIGLPQGVIGLWAYAAPRHFFDSFPSGAEPWLPFFGPYDGHLVADFGALSLALGIVVVVAAVRLHPLLTRVALWGWVAWSAPHFVTHAQLAGHMSRSAFASNAISTALAVLVPAVALWLVHRPTTPERSTAKGIPDDEVLSR